MKGLLWAGAALVVLGLPAGVLWWWIAEPARWTVSGGELMMDEQAAGHQFAMTGWFAVIGIVFSLVAGLVMDRLFHRVGWPVFVVVAVAAGLAAVVAAQLGLLIGPPDPSTVKHLTAGQTVPTRLRVDGVAPYLAWAAAASLGALVSAWFRGEDEEPESEFSALSAPSSPA